MPTPITLRYRSPVASSWRDVRARSPGGYRKMRTGATGAAVRVRSTRIARTAERVRPRSGLKARVPQQRSGRHPDARYPRLGPEAAASRTAMRLAAEAAKHRRQRIEQWPKVERSEGTPQSARRRTGRSTKCDVGSPGAAGALRGRAPSEGGAGGSISRAEAARHRRQRIEQSPVK